MAKNYKSLFGAGISGLLLALAYPGWGFELGFLAWIGFVPLFYTLSNTANRHDRGDLQYSSFSKRCFLTGLVAGLFYFLIVFRWFWSIHPLDTLGIQNKIASLAIVLLIYFISSAGMAVFWGFFGAAYGYWLQLTTPTIKPKKPDSNLGTIVPKLESWEWPPALVPGLLAASFFTLTEYARSYGFGLLWAGSGTLLGPHWTLGNLAYALVNSILALKLSPYIGIYGICFLIILANFIFFKILAKKNLFSIGIAALIVLLIAFGPKFLPKKEPPSSEKKINFAAIQTNQPTKISLTPKETLAAFKEQLDLLKRVAQEHPESQLIIFPEASDFFKNLSLFLTNAQVQDYFTDLFKEPRLIVAGARVIDADGRAYSRVFSLDTQKDIIGFYDKRLLTPEGEFLSYPTRLIVNLLSKTKVSEFGALRELEVGRKKVSTVGFRDQFSTAPIVCSEIWAPNLTRKVPQGSDIIVGMASYGIFHGDNSLIRQTLAAARFRAAENQKPLIVASNMGLSYAVDSGGNVDFVTPNQAPQILTGSVALNPPKSWYNRVGDIPVLVGSLVLVVIFALFPMLKHEKYDFNVKFQSSNDKSNPKLK